MLLLSLLSATVYASNYNEPVDEEYEKVLSKKYFDLINGNDDDKISFDELLRYVEEKRQKQLDQQLTSLFEACDKNADDRIAMDEAFVIKENDQGYYDYSGTNNYPTASQKVCHMSTDRLEAYDKNGDGFMDKTEAEESLNSITPNAKLKKKQQSRHEKQRIKQTTDTFYRCDTDKDKQLSLREAASINCNMVTERFDAHDKNGDGFLSLEERLLNIQYTDYAKPATPVPSRYTYTSAYQQTPYEKLSVVFYSCDTDQDGRLAKGETVAKNCDVEIWFFSQTDRNEDGFISGNEYKIAEIKNNFDTMDVNKDGLLDTVEFKGSKVRYY